MLVIVQLIHAKHTSHKDTSNDDTEMLLSLSQQAKQQLEGQHKARQPSEIDLKKIQACVQEIEERVEWMLTDLAKHHQTQERGQAGQHRSDEGRKEQQQQASDTAKINQNGTGDVGTGNKNLTSTASAVSAAEKDEDEESLFVGIAGDNLVGEDLRLNIQAIKDFISNLANDPFDA